MTTAAAVINIYTQGALREPEIYGLPSFLVPDIFLGPSVPNTHNLETFQNAKNWQKPLALTLPAVFNLMEYNVLLV